VANVDDAYVFDTMPSVANVEVETEMVELPVALETVIAVPAML
jgi:hypothetical protein